MRVWVNGCFDILHSGHIDLLWFAKRYGVTKKKQNKLSLKKITRFSQTYFRSSGN